MAIGEAIVYRGDPSYVNRDLDDLQAVTAADVQRVLRKYVLDAKQVTIEYVQDPKSRGQRRGQGADRGAHAMKPSRRSLPAFRLLPTMLLAQPFDTPPPAAPPRPFVMPAPSVATLDNGLRVVVAQRSDCRSSRCS